MKISIVFLSAVTALVAGCGDSSKPGTAANSVSNEVTAPLNYLGTVVQAKKDSEKQIDLAYVKEGIQMFQVSEGRFPKNLQELVPNYIGKVPVAPNGYKISYDPATGEVKVVKQ